MGHTPSNLVHTVSNDANIGLNAANQVFLMNLVADNTTWDNSSFFSDSNGFNNKIVSRGSKSVTPTTTVTKIDPATGKPVTITDHAVLEQSIVNKTKTKNIHNGYNVGGNLSDIIGNLNGATGYQCFACDLLVIL